MSGVSTDYITHRGEYVITSAGDPLGGAPAKPCAGSRNEYALGHRFLAPRSNGRKDAKGKLSREQRRTSSHGVPPESYRESRMERLNARHGSAASARQTSHSCGTEL